MGSPGSLRAALCCMFAFATDAFQLAPPGAATARPFQLAPPGATTARLSARSAALLVMRQPDSRSRTREQLLPDLLAALDEVALFISKADRSRMRKPEAPSAECIEAFCAVQQKKVGSIARDRAVVSGVADAKRGTGGPITLTMARCLWTCCANPNPDLNHNLLVARWTCCWRRRS